MNDTQGVVVAVLDELKGLVSLVCYELVLNERGFLHIWKLTDHPGCQARRWQ